MGLQLSIEMRKPVLIFLYMCLFFVASNSPANTEMEIPFISDLNVEPSSGPVGTEYRITLHITDPQGQNDLVQILHQMREGVEVITIPLNDDGVAGDLKKGDGIFSGSSIVPQTASKSTHRFEVFVRDKAGHRSNLLEYRFTVLEGRLV